MDRVFRVQSPRAAALLATPEMARLLKPFMREARSCSQVAQELQVSVGWLYYRVQKLTAAGLLREVSQKKRNGKPLRFYQAVSRRFLIACDLFPARQLAELYSSQACKDEFEEAIRVYRFDLSGQLVVELQPGGALTWRPAAGPIDLSGHPAAVLDHHTSALFLSHADAQALRQELRTLIRRYEGRRGPHRYGLVAGMVPLERPVDG